LNAPENLDDDLMVRTEEKIKKSSTNPDDYEGYFYHLLK